LIHRKLFFVICIIIVFSGVAFSRKIPSARNYGKVIINNFSRKAGLAPVVFDHWLHRSRFTCRLCHIDIGFAMDAGGTEISAATNMQGFYCGACHDGERIFNGKKIFKACSEDSPEIDRKRCGRCHSRGKKTEREHDFNKFAEKLPRFSIGDAIDWEKAEDQGLIKPVDFIEGISYRRDALKAQEDFSINSKADWMTDVIFSHKKHAAWNGCGLCHPDIFPSTKKGTVKYTMFQIFNNQYCGVCHGRVAFSLFLCHKCHVNPVQ
jgi:c(7)-type cytochrome triheme protein